MDCTAVTSTVLSTRYGGGGPGVARDRPGRLHLLKPEAPSADKQDKKIQGVSSQGSMSGMVPTTAAIRIYLNQDRQGVVTCVHCGVKRTINMSNYTDDCLGKRSLKVKCSTCHKIFQIKFDLRHYHRLDVDFPGKICHCYSGKDIDNIMIISLSLGGVGFIINNNLKIKVGEVYLIQFQLDDEDSSVICEEIRIKRVDGRCVGAEFYHSEKYNHELDFYIAEASWDT